MEMGTKVLHYEKPWWEIDDVLACPGAAVYQKAQIQMSDAHRQ